MNKLNTSDLKQMSRIWISQEPGKMVLTYKECGKPRVILFHMVVFQMVLGSNGTSWKILLWNGASKGTDRYSLPSAAGTLENIVSKHSLMVTLCEKVFQITLLFLYQRELQGTRSHTLVTSHNYGQSRVQSKDGNDGCN